MTYHHATPFRAGIIGAGAYERLAAGVLWLGTAGGTVNALTVSTGIGIVSPIKDQIIGLYVPSSNTGTATISVDGGSAIPIKKNGSPLSGGELRGEVLMQYDGISYRLLSSCFQNILINGVSTTQRPSVNYIPGYGIDLSVSDNPSAGRLDVTVAAARIATLDPLNKGPDVKLSTDLLTASALQAYTGISGCRGPGRSSGKVYYEIVGGFREETGIGIVSSAVDLTNTNVNSAVGAAFIFGYPNGDKFIRVDGASVALSGENPYGDKVIGIFVDLDARKWWYAINGVIQAGGNPLTGVNSLPGCPASGSVHPLIRIRVFPGETVTVRFHPASWQYSPPTGFGPW